MLDNRFLQVNNVITEEEIKSFMRLLVEQAKMYPIIYKYLTFESGCQMLLNHNIQFTRGDKLNDIEDLNISKFSTEVSKELCKNIGISTEVFENKFNEKATYFSSLGICSLGISPLNSVLWNRYTHSESGCEDGICIGINQNKVIKALIKQGIKTACIVVRYEPSVSSSIPWLSLSASSPVKIFAGYQFFALKKSNPWEKEQEIRLIYSEPMDSEYVRFILPKDCFEIVYYGKNMTISQKQKIGQIMSRNLSKTRRILLTQNSKYI